MEDFLDKILYPVPGYEGYYCNEAGEVYSARKGKLRECKGNPDKNGYINVMMVKNHKPTWWRKHRVIMLTFVGESDMQVNHKNGVVTDNRLCNLEYVTRQENQCHRRLKAGYHFGVCWAKKEGKWRAYLQHNKVWEHLGFYSNYDDAKAAYLRRCKELGITNKYAE